MTHKPHEVLATREARAQLPALLERFRQAGADAEPVVIGARRRPEAVVLSYERYLQLAGGRERVAAALDQQAREASETLDADEAIEVADQ
jgi:antitoxin StbD